MSKRLLAKTDTYQNQAGEQKNSWTEIGIQMSNDNGDYFLLDPSVNLAGILVKQNILAMKEGKPARSNVMVSAFEQNQQQNQQQGQQQQPQSGWGSQQQQQGQPQQQQPNQYQQQDGGWNQN